MVVAMQLSFIIPVHNAEKTLRSCLDSILSLKLDPAEREILVVNNGSTDLSAEILSEYDEVYTLTYAWASRSKARNTGAMHARGKWCVFVDADVELEASWAQEMMAAISQNQAQVFHGPIIPANTDGQEGLNRYRYHLAHEKTGGTFSLYFINVRESPMINSAVCVYERKLFYELGGFDEALERHEDIDLSKRASLISTKFHYVAKARAFVHYHDQGWWSYAVRAFREGMTKVDYLAKWEQMLKGQPVTKGLKPQWDQYVLHKTIHLLIRVAGRLGGHLFRAPRFTPLDQKSRLQYIERPD